MPAIELEFNILNEESTISRVFKTAENFQFQFIIRNNSSSQISFDPGFIDEDFFRVFETKFNGDSVSIGQPYKNLFCTFTGSHFVIHPNSEYRFEIPWSPLEDNCCPPFCLINKNTLLEKGKYKTIINGPFNFIVNGESLSMNEAFTIDFEIK